MVALTRHPRHAFLLVHQNTLSKQAIGPEVGPQDRAVHTCGIDFNRPTQWTRWDSPPPYFYHPGAFVSSQQMRRIVTEIQNGPF